MFRLTRIPWRLVTALQAIGSGLRRSESWRERMQKTARRRLRRPEATVEQVSEGWLKPLEKKGRHLRDEYTHACMIQ